MIPIPPFVVELAAKYGMKIISALALTAAISAGYMYWKHTIYKQGVNDQIAEYDKRDADTKRQSEELLKLKNHEIDQAKQQNREDYLKALEIYGNENIRLTNELNANINRRLFVPIKAKPSNCNRDTMPTKARISESASGRSGAIDWAELVGEDAKAVWRTRDEVIRMALLCKNQIEFIKKNAIVK